MPLLPRNEDKLINRASVLVMIWSARLAGFLLFRVLKTGSDTRFDEMRSHFFRFAGFWAGQILWVWVVCTLGLSFIWSC
jgi:steroid 5-alpha reductase family enzyme